MKLLSLNRSSNHLLIKNISAGLLCLFIITAPGKHIVYLISDKAPLEMSANLAEEEQPIEESESQKEESKEGFEEFILARGIKYFHQSEMQRLMFVSGILPVHNSFEKLLTPPPQITIL